MPKAPLLQKEEVFRVVGSAMNVHCELGPGFLEAVYHEALEIQFVEDGIPFGSKAELNIRFKDRLLKKRYEADFVCFGTVIVEIKAQDHLTSVDQAQILNYLKATGTKVGVLLNFGSSPTLEWKRFVY